MIQKSLMSALLILCLVFTAVAQNQDEIVEQIVLEATENSQIEEMAHHLMDVIGPRLVGTPQMQHAHDWAVETFENWGITARNEQFGEWRGWERGITHVDMISPRVVTLEAMQLAWSPPTPEGGVEAGLVIIPEVSDEEEFSAWLPNAEGKFVMISMHQPTGRPDYNWEEFATEESLEKIRQERQDATRAWRERIANTGHNNRTLVQALEEAGAAGIIMSNWSQGFGTNKIFGAGTENIPTIDILLEDYGMLYRLVESGHDPVIRVRAESKDHGVVPTFNTIAEIRGTEKPDEYIILSAHYDSWEAGTGATDNGTGSITMMEVARILKKIYPNPKRTILVGLWGAEEQGLNGSAAFVEDNPDIVEGLQALFNQDNGTGRVVSISGQGFVNSYDYLGRWLSAAPRDVTQHIETTFPGMPSGGGSDHASFVSAGAPGFFLSSLNWSYWNYTWHTNRDTYDKLVFDDVRNNVILIATLAYMASEDPEKTSRERRVLPINPRTGEQMTWPNPRTPNRRGGLN
ncbi:M20/M25/M40 family metallo-hydrolase [Rhodohalobacter mucosus]|uniref:Carboxypeptidase Q n=1 Tax=Rhodohalobacter mucosus TaxID=2079485 RepID=A0A316TST9_9BACT|nr:peptidase M28 [Rhodohalobacter mucosus]